VTSLRLLVVDDDAVDRITVKRLISRSGLRDTVVQEASDSAGALAVLAEEGGGRADCILLDYHLAGETGLDVLEALRVRQISTPVIVLTGQSDPETAAALVKAGARMASHPSAWSRRFAAPFGSHRPSRRRNRCESGSRPRSRVLRTPS
jgi:CheY-like chemotaxis protein